MEINVHKSFCVFLLSCESFSLHGPETHSSVVSCDKRYYFHEIKHVFTVWLLGVTTNTFLYHQKAGTVLFWTTVKIYSGEKDCEITSNKRTFLYIVSIFPL